MSSSVTYTSNSVATLTTVTITEPSRSVFVLGFCDRLTKKLTEEIRAFFSKHGTVEEIVARYEPVTKRFLSAFDIYFESHEEAKRVSKMNLNFHRARLHMMNVQPDYIKWNGQGFDFTNIKSRDHYNYNSYSNGSAHDDYDNYISNKLIHFVGAGINADYAKIRLYMERNYARIKYVTYNPKTKSGIIELVDPYAEQVVKAMIEDGVFFDNVIPKFRVLEGKEKTSYYKHKRMRMFKTKVAQAATVDTSDVNINESQVVIADVTNNNNIVINDNESRVVTESSQTLSNPQPKGKKMMSASVDNEDSNKNDVDKSNEKRIIRTKQTEVKEVVHKYNLRKRK
nr:258_t:CDS:2 [Entrophospora candida]